MKIESVARQQMACLGDASRYRIVSELATGQACVTELAGRIGLSQSCTTRHLQALERAGLVSRERAGRRVLFTVRSQDPAVRSLLDWKTRLETDADLSAGPGAGPPRARAGTGSRGSRPRKPASPRQPGSESGPGRDGAGLDGNSRTPGTAPESRPARAPFAGSRRAEPPAEEPSPDRGSGSDVAEPPLPPRRIHQELEDFLL